MARRLVQVLGVVAGIGVVAVVVFSQGPRGKQERPGITNFTQVDAVIACAGATEVTALDALKADGFKSIINLRQAQERGVNLDESRARAEAVGLTYIHIPFNAGSPDPSVIDQFLAAVATPANQPAFVHCGSASRVGAVMIAKRVLQDKWDIEKAVEEAKMIGLRGEPLEKFARDYVAAHRQ
jgi:uncharacterized protein (TIGR01244 family)